MCAVKTLISSECNVRKQKARGKGKGKGKLYQIILAKWKGTVLSEKELKKTTAKNDKQENPEEREHTRAVHMCAHPALSSHTKQSRGPDSLLLWWNFWSKKSENNR